MGLWFLIKILLVASKKGKNEKEMKLPLKNSM